jgi:hypothetical protein
MASNMHTCIMCVSQAGTKLPHISNMMAELVVNQSARSVVGWGIVDHDDLEVGDSFDPSSFPGSGSIGSGGFALLR